MTASIAVSDPLTMLHPASTADGSSEGNWLASLPIRRSAPPRLFRAARAGDAESFGRELQRDLQKSLAPPKRDQLRVLENLGRLGFRNSAFGVVEDAASLAHCLFDHDMESDELSGRVETILAGNAEAAADVETLRAAYWLLRFSPQRFEPQTLLALWRWTWESSRRFFDEITITGAEEGIEALNPIEIQWLLSQTFIQLKGSRKLARTVAERFRQALAALTDEDGTPHSRTLPLLLPALRQLGRIGLADGEKTLWDRSSRQRMAGLLERTASLLTPQRFAFSDVEPDAVFEVLETVAEATHADRQRAILAQFERRPAGRKSRRRSRTQTCFQSDWANWAMLRDGWESPVDQCVVRYSGTMPEIEVVVGDLPLLSGAWSHELSVDGRTASPVGPWNCVCWFVDKTCAYVELQQDHDLARVVRQATLIRGESVLVIADSVKAVEGQRIEFSRSIPLVGGWSDEEDGATRELALELNEQRVRVFPVTSPQLLTERSDESTHVERGRLQLRANVDAPRLYAASVFDWLPKRSDEPADWTRLTVAEEGRQISPLEAVAHRLRVGKSQWILYHSLAPAATPRTALGLHTTSETVVARLDKKGELDSLLEVQAD